MTYDKKILNRFLSDKVAIAVRTAKEWNKFMYLLKEETHAKWFGGKNPTGLNKWHEYGDDSAITCGYLQPPRLEYADTSFYEESGYEIIEFEELIKGKDEMTNQNYRDLFVKTKIEGFVNSQYKFKENFENYRGYLISDLDYKQKEYCDFLLEMQDYGIERDEIEEIIIKDYLTEEENDEIEQIIIKDYLAEKESDSDKE